MELIGRETELSAVSAAVDAAGAGAGRTLTLVGEAGIGKSALLAALAKRAEAAGLLVLAGRAAEHEHDVPFGLVVDALDDHVAALHPKRLEAVGPELGAVLPSAARGNGAAARTTAAAAERFRYHRALRALLGMLAREQPVVLIADDLHWADDASLELVLHLVRRPPPGPLLLAVALRPTEPVARLLDAARGAAGWEHLAVGPLAPDAARGLVGDVPDARLRERVLDEAGGNPLFLEELAKAARRPGDPLPPDVGHAARGPDGALPPTIVAAVQREAAGLPPAARTLLDGAAVAGDPFDPELAAAAAGLDAAGALEPLDALVATGLARPAGHGRLFAFRHPLVRRAVYDAAPPAWRLAAHQRAAATLAARGAGPAQRAYHVAQAAQPGDDEAVALLVAAAAASTDTAPGTAAHWYAAALRLLPGGVRRRAELLGPMAMALAAAGRLAEARDAMVEAPGLLPPGAPLRQPLVAMCASVEGQIGRHAEAGRRILAELEATRGDSPRLALAMAEAAYYEGNAAELSKWAGRALATDLRPPLEAGALALMAVGELWQFHPDASRRAFDRALARLGELPDDVLAGELGMANHVGLAGLLSERYPETIAVTTRGLAISRATRQGRVIAALAVIRCMAYKEQLELDESLRDAEVAEESARLQNVPGVLSLALWNAALTHHARGEEQACERAARECAEVLAGMERSLLTCTGRANLAAMLVERDPERCARELLDAGGPGLERLDPTWVSWLTLRLVRALLATGRTEEAAEWAERLEARGEAIGLPATAVRGATAQAEVLLARDRPADAAAVVTARLDRADGAQLRMEAAEARLVAGRALAAAGDRDGAAALLQRLTEDAARGGAARLRDGAARELRRLGLRPSAGARRAAGTAGGGELTAREREIVQLVAAGRSNKQVAAALFLSEKTIEHNLSRAYAKLGVRSRVELAARMA